MTLRSASLSTVLAAITELADDNGIVRRVGERVADKLSISIQSVVNAMRLLTARGALVRIVIGEYRVTSAMPKAKAYREQYPTARALGIEPITHLRPHVTDGGVSIVEVSLARVPWLERPL